MDSAILDLNAVWWGVPLTDLMEAAGEAIAAECLGFSNIAIMAGRGNNGGDGLVAARRLKDRGIKARVFALEGTRTWLNQMNLERLDSHDVTFIRDADDFDLAGFDLIVDALIGVGISGELRQPLARIIEKVNASAAHKLSVDMPSAGAVEADAVLSLHSAKVPGAKVVDIGIPKEAETYVGPGDLYHALPKREKESHKGDFGRLLIIGGSKEYIGAPSLAAMAALRSGCDLVTLCVPGYVADRMHYDPNLMVARMEGQDYITEADIDAALKIKSDAIVFGNGLGRESSDAVRHLLESADRPIVLDADGLSLCRRDWLNDKVIATPHKGEYERVFGGEAKEEGVGRQANESGAVIALKGGIDIISDGQTTRLNKSGNPCMTCGGTGDVLAGIIGGLLAQNGDRFSSACAGTFLSGLAGDIAAGYYGVSLVATDVLAHVPEAISFCTKLGEEV